MKCCHHASECRNSSYTNSTITGSHERSLLCAPLEPIAGNAEFVQLLAWVTCEVSFNPLSPVPGLFPALTGVPKADDDSLYVVYLPRSVTILEGGSDSFSAYHFFGAAPDIDIVVPRSQTFAFAVRRDGVRRWRNAGRHPKLDLKAGEASDICAANGTLLDPPASRTQHSRFRSRRMIRCCASVSANASS